MDSVEEGYDRARDRRAESEAMLKQEEEIEHKAEPLDEDLYGIGITSLLRDTRRLASSEGKYCLRISRLTATSMLLVANMLLQAFLLAKFNTLVTQAAIHNMRVTYDGYQEAMYDPPLDITVNGFHRGRRENFKPERFQQLSASQKKLLCNCPLSQPGYLAAVLAIWTCTVVADLRKMCFLMELMFIRTPNVDSFRNMLSHKRDDGTMILEGLTRSIKFVIFSMMFLPRIVIDVVLLWLGCCWLVATANFSEVLVNAMALEFLLVLKDLFYTAAVPHRDKLETRQMLIPTRRTDEPSFAGYFGSFGWIIVVLIWVFVYLSYLQVVLPDYRWDIGDVCHAYILDKTNL